MVPMVPAFSMMSEGQTEKGQTITVKLKYKVVLHGREHRSVL